MFRNSTPGLPLHHAQSKMQTTGFSPSDSRGSSPLPSPGKSQSRSQSKSRDPASSVTSAYSILTREQTAERLSSSLASGLSSTEAIKRLHEYGPNELPREEPEPLWARFLKQFQETLILLLLGSAGISFVMGNLEDAISIGAAVTIVVTVGFVQEYRSEKSLEALSHLVPHSAHVIRNSVDQTLSRDNRILDNGMELSVLPGDMPSSQVVAGQTTTTIPAGQLVPGDLVLFNTGDRIPADLRITQSADLSIDESNLTGENEPVSKSPPSVTSQGSARANEQPQHLAPQYYEPSITDSVGGVIRLNEQSNIAFMGTLVRSGHGQGIVVGTGGNTAFGAISASLQEIESPRTPLQLSMDRLGKELSYMSFGVIGFIMLLGLWRGWKFLEMFQIGVSLAVAAIPEGLPIIVTVTLALGVLRMSKKDAIVRRLPSVETLGSVNVVCSDKTGTLTTNHMTVTKLWYLDEKAPIDVSQIHSSTTLNPATRTIIRIGNIVNNSRLLDGHSLSRSAVSSAAILSSMGGDGTSHVNSRWRGQPTDVALLDLMDVLGEEDVRERLGGRRSEMPFSSERKWMGVITQGSIGNPGGAEVAFIKGALEKVLDRCDTYLTADGREVILDSQRRTEVSLAAESMASDGLRVLGFASGQVRSTGVNSSWGRSNGLAVDKSIAPSDEDLYRGLVFAGLVGIHDPPRKGVDKSIRRLMAGGVKVIMITGDSETTAVAIGKKLGMPINMASAIGRPVLRGDEIDSMSEEELMQAIGTTTIFARTTPEHKMQIIKALQARGDVVAMTGDGVNDAPALKKADIGVSMGTTGTDVAKEAADMILIDDNFSTILSAIEEGKGIFYNIQNFLTFQLSTSAAALSLVLLSTVLGLKNPLNAMQILWINILMDGPPAQSLGVEPVDPAVMMRRPRSRDARVLTKPLIQRVLQSASIIMFGTLMTYIHEMNADGQVTARDTTMTFTCFVLFDMFNALTCRSEEKSVLAGEIGLFSNKMFNYSVSGSLIGQAAVVYLPILQRIFQTEALSLMDIVHLIAVASCVFWADEGRKFYKRWKRGRALVGYSTNV